MKKRDAKAVLKDNTVFSNEDYQFVSAKRGKAKVDEHYARGSSFEVY